MFVNSYMYKNKGVIEQNMFVLTILEVSLQTEQSWGGCEARGRLLESWQGE